MMLWKFCVWTVSLSLDTSFSHSPILITWTNRTFDSIHRICGLMRIYVNAITNSRPTRIINNEFIHLDNDSIFYDSIFTATSMPHATSTNMKIFQHIYVTPHNQERNRLHWHDLLIAPTMNRYIVSLHTRMWWSSVYGYFVALWRYTILHLLLFCLSIIYYLFIIYKICMCVCALWCRSNISIRIESTNRIWMDDIPWHYAPHHISCEWHEWHRSQEVYPRPPMQSSLHNRNNTIDR